MKSILMDSCRFKAGNQASMQNRQELYDELSQCGVDRTNPKIVIEIRKKKFMKEYAWQQQVFTP